MKALFLYLNLFVCIANTSAQDTTIVNFYANSLTENYSDNDKTMPLIMQHFYYKNEMQAVILQKNTNKPIFSIKATEIVLHQKEKSSIYLPNKNFTYTRTNGGFVQYNARKKCMMHYDENKTLRLTYTYKLQKKDTATIVTTYYYNKKIHTVKKYKNTLIPIALLCANNSNSASIDRNFSLYLETEKPNEYTVYYPNGNLYYTGTVNVSYSDNENYNYYSLHIHDSTGTKLNSNNYTNPTTHNKENEWLTFFDNGNIAKKTFYSPDTLHPNTTIDYTKTGTIDDINYDYTPINKKAAYIYTAQYQKSYYENDAQNYQTLAHLYNYNLFTNHNPLFYIAMDSARNVISYSNGTNAKPWFKNACPPTKPPTITGIYDGILPHGDWQIFNTDSAGNVIGRHIKAHFNKGILHGQAQIYDADNQREIADIRFDNGKILYSKYQPTEYHPQPQGLNSDEYMAHLLTRQDQINARNTPETQHNAYRAKQSAVWQRDTVLFLPSNDYVYQNTDEIDQHIQRLILTQFTPDENSLMQYTFNNPKNYDNGNTINIFFHKKTGDLDSISTITNNAQKKCFFYFDKKRYIFSNSNDVNTNIQRPNDSVFIYNTYTDGLFKHLSTARIDSFYYDKNYKNEAHKHWAMPYKIDFWLPKYLDSVKVWRNPSKQIASSKHYLHGFLRLSMPLYDFTAPPARPEYHIYKSTTYRYDDFGKADAVYKNGAFQPFNPAPNPIDSVEWLNNLPNKNGVYTLYNNTYSATFKNNKKHGSELTRDANGLPMHEDLYDSNKLIAQKIYNYVPNYINQGLIDTFRTESFIDTTAQQTKYFYYKNNLKSRAYRLENHFSSDTTFWRNNPSANIVLERLYLEDSVGKAHLIVENTQTAPKHFEHKIFYLNGNLHTKTTNDTYAPIQYNLMPNDETKYRYYSAMPYADLHDIYAPIYIQKLTYWDNQNLQEQASNNGTFSCTYNEKGNIQSEHLYKDESVRYFDYPPDNPNNNCGLDALPYQIGKMQNGHRVGEWKGYARDTTKTLLYTLPYDENGNLNGEVFFYDKYQNTVCKTNIKDGKKHGTERFYKNNFLLKETQYDNDKCTNIKEYDTNNYLLSEIVYYKNTNHIAKKTSFHKNTTQPERIYIVKFPSQTNDTTNEDRLDQLPFIAVDSTFDAQHRLLTAGFFDSKTNLNSVTKKQNNKYVTTQNIGAIRIYTDDKIYEDSMYNKIKTQKYKTAKKDKTTAKNQKIIDTFVQNWQTVDLQNLHNTQHATDIREQMNNPKTTTAIATTTKQITIQQNTGETLNFYTPDSITCKMITQTPTKNNFYNPILLPNEYYTNGYFTNYDDSGVSIANSCYAAEKYLLCYSNTQIYCAKTYPAKILHPTNSTKNATIWLNTPALSLVKTAPAYYYSAFKLHEMYINSDAKQIYDTLKTLRPQTYEMLSFGGIPQHTQQYEIGNTGIQLLPLSFYCTNNLLHNPRNLQAQGDNFEWNTTHAYPHHSIQNPQNKTRADTFLKADAFYLILTQANISFPFLQNKTATDVLIMPNEINFSINAYEDQTITEAHDKIIAYAASHNLNLIIKHENKTIYNSKIPVIKPTIQPEIDKITPTYYNAIYYFNYKP